MPPTSRRGHQQSLSIRARAVLTVLEASSHGGSSIVIMIRNISMISISIVITSMISISIISTDTISLGIISIIVVILQITATGTDMHECIHI